MNANNITLTNHNNNSLHQQILAVANRDKSSNQINVRIVCPVCSHTRKKKNERTMSVSFLSDKTVYKCHHCGEQGAIFPKKQYVKRYQPVRMVKVEEQPASLQWLQDKRHISKEVIEKYRILASKKYFHKLDREADCVGFPYLNGDNIYAVKYRTSTSDKECKAHIQEGTGGAQTFFGIEQVSQDAKQIVICEGEIDALSLATAGVDNAISVPNGAPLQASSNPVDETNDRKYGFVWAAKDLLKNVEKVVLAVDLDGPGQALAEELARRIGKVKCYQVEWPDGCKDSNDVLIKFGREKLSEVIDTSTPWPIVGLFDADHYADDVDKIYQQGHQRGLSTGLDNVDELFTIPTGQLSIVTGHPSSGKSEFIDQIMVNLAESYSWTFAVCSFENDPPSHIIKLIEKHVGIPFHDGPTQRMSKDEMIAGRDWVGKHFFFIEQNDGEPATIESILERAQASILRYGVRGVIIDPYNYVDIDKSSVSETEAISKMLTKCRLFAKAHDVHVWFVAHPAKMVREGGEFPAPKGYDISGSAAWFAKADLGITVHRKQDTPFSEIHCWKVRFKWVGQQGMTEVEYEKPTGRFREPLKYQIQTV